MSENNTQDLARIKKIRDIFNFLDKVSLKYKDEAFVMSLQDYFNQHGDLTDRQFFALLNVYERV